MAGLTPQVLTETLFALNQTNRRVDAIHVITTRDGRDKLLSDLLAGGRGPYHRFLQEFGIPDGAIDFNPANIHVVRDASGVEITDIENEGDNEQLLRKYLELSFHFPGNSGPEARRSGEPFPP